MKRTDANIIEVKQFPDKETPGQEAVQSMTDNGIDTNCTRVNIQGNKNRPEPRSRSRKGPNEKQKIRI